MEKYMNIIYGHFKLQHAVQLRMVEISGVHNKCPVTARPVISSRSKPSPFV